MASKSKSSSSTKEKGELPDNAVARFWVNLYRTVPVVNLPGTQFPISFSLCSACFLYAVRIGCAEVLRTVWDWPAEPTREAVGSLAALVHALLLVPGLYAALTTQPYLPTAHLSQFPLWWQELVDALLQTCTGYMIYDSVASFFMIKGFAGLEGTDFMFLGHHLATTIYMSQCRYLQAGHTSAMICMLLGEFTNPWQNGNMVLKHAVALDCCNGLWMQRIDAFVEFGFAFFYFTIRAFVAPIFFAHVTFCLLLAETRTNIPLGMRLWWIFLIWAVEVGSYDWIVTCWEMLQDYYEKGIFANISGANGGEL